MASIEWWANHESLSHLRGWSPIVAWASKIRNYLSRRDRLTDSSPIK